MCNVREHHAPVGALRLGGDLIVRPGGLVREHHAPVGALRLEGFDGEDFTIESGSTTHL